MTPSMKIYTGLIITGLQSVQASFVLQAGMCHRTIEWQVLIDYLGGDKIAGSKLKEAGKNNWITSNKDATNQSGFTALPAGLREAIDGTFGGQGYIGGWWSATESTSSIYGTAYARSIYGDTTVAARNEII